MTHYQLTLFDVTFSFRPIEVMLAAAAIVVTLPVLLLTIFIQKEIVVGMTHGGVKGG